MKLYKTLRSRSLQGVVCFLAISLATSMIFQNCAEPLDLAEQDASTFSDSLPFAYDVKMDTFAFMSCKPDVTEYDRRALFNFRVGAFEPGAGLKLSDEFLKATGNFSDSAKVDALYRSPTNTGAILQLAIRWGAFDYRITQVKQDDGAAEPGKSLGNYFTGVPLDAPGIATKLVELPEGERARYLKGVPGLDGRMLVESLRYFENFDKVTSNLNDGDTRVTVTYTTEDDEYNDQPRGPDPADTRRSVYGQEFRPGLTAPMRWGSTNIQMNTVSNADRVVTRLDVIDLQDLNRAAPESWVCPETLRYLVVRPGDENKDMDSTTAVNRLCPKSNVSWSYDTPPAGREKELEILRRVLPVEDYYINMSKRCIIPKAANDRNSCYPAAATKILYNSTTCNDDPDNDHYECPHFVSICVHPSVSIK